MKLKVSIGNFLRRRERKRLESSQKNERSKHEIIPSFEEESFRFNLIVSSHKIFDERKEDISNNNIEESSIPIMHERKIQISKLLDFQE